MDQAYRRQKYESLSDGSIDAALDLAERYMTDNGVAQEQKASLRALLEALLRAYQRRGEDAGFSLDCQRRTRSVCFALSVAGESCNALPEIPETLLDALDEATSEEYRKLYAEEYDR